jgi:hypothetical protein
MKIFYAALLSLFFGSALAATPPASAQLKGQVLEVIDAGQYTYLRLKTADGETWAAVLHAPVAKGAQVAIQDPMVMTKFESKTLKKTFDKIVFGTLAGSAPAAPAALPAQAHAAAGAAATPEQPIGKIARATGADARTVAEVVAQGAQLKNRSVTVRAKVVKVSSNIMGKNWVRVRDGSGSAADGSNELLVTTTQVATVGDVVVVKGVVHTNVDLGSGYSYKVLVEDATLTK